jgi:hypothetical protein
MSNDIVKPITPDGMCGFDSYGQLWVWWLEDPKEPERKTGTIVADVRGKICPICQKGWLNTTDSIRDQTYLQAMSRHVHRSCEYGSAHVNNFYFWHDLVCDNETNVKGLKFEETANLYGSKWTGPWYRVKFNHIDDHEFILGSRKRVYHMEMTNVFDKDELRLLEEAFKDQDVTKYHSEEKSFVIHAHGKEDAKKYIKIMVKIATHPLFPA